jgi:hypothetical protein
VDPWTNRLVSVAVAVRLLPEDRQLTLTDRRRDAWCLLLGSVVLAAAWAARVWLLDQ